MNTPINPPNNSGTELCKAFKELLVEQGESGIAQQTGLAAHLEVCAECQRLLQAWNEIPELLEQLPEHEPDAALVKRVQDTVSSSARRTPTTNVNTNSRRRFLAPSLASAAILLAAVGLSREMLLRESPRLPLDVPGRHSEQQPLTRGLGGATSAPEQKRNNHLTEEKMAGKELSDLRYVDELANSEAELENQSRPGNSNRKADEQVPILAQDSGQRSDDALRNSVSDKEGRYRKMQAEKPETVTVTGSIREGFDASKFAAEPAIAPQPQSLPAKKQADNPGAKDALLFADNDRPNAAVEEGARRQVAAQSKLKTEDPDGKSSRDSREAGAFEQLNQPVSPPLEKNARAKQRLEADLVSHFDFLDFYQASDGLVFQPATGYWANQYIPGDPEIRLLSARLAEWDRSWLAGNADLERAVQSVAQPFDAPADNALSLSLMSDAAGIAANGVPTRLRLQVGIQGIEHRKGVRPAMNVAVVVDLPVDASDEVRIATRVLLEALLESKQAGDSFSLVLTGMETGFPGLVVEADDFRFGSLQLAQQAILGEPVANTLLESAPVSADQAFIDIATALRRAGAMVQEGDENSDRPLGSSAVLLISARELPDLEQLTRITHEHARLGISTSVFPLGKQAQGDQAGKLVLAGLGNRRYLEAPADARRLVENELHAASRAVARAARLSIRLAPGVKLLKVIGSERLDADQSQRVRDIENTLDQRLSADLGIQADRGEDEEGIQIVIPGIYSGDSVTVLLDLVTDRPGAIADVTLRYKDLVFLKNGSLSGQLELPRADGVTAERGPAELSVLKNLLAWHFSTAVEQAAAALGRGDTRAAIQVLRAMHATIEQARRDLPAWSNEPDLERDQQVLERYIAALESPQAAHHQSILSDSLRLAAFAKTHGLPKEWN